MRARDDGFTMLELLIVIAVTSILLTTALQSYIQIMQAQERSLAENRRDGVAALVLDRLEGELVGTLLVKEGAALAATPAASRSEEAGRGEETEQAGRGREDEPEEGESQNPWIFIGEDGGPGERASDSIRFVTQTPARGVGVLSSAGLRVVSYVVRSTEGDRAALYRAEDLLSGAAPEPPSFGETPAVDDVYRLKIRYQTESAEWLESWDSQSEENKDDLPIAVELTLQLEERDETGEFKVGRELTRTVALPLRPIGEDDEEDDDSEKCGTGKQTIEQCLSNFVDDTQLGTDPAARNAFDKLRSEIGKFCFDDNQNKEKVGDKLATLLEQLANLGGPNL